MSRKKHIKHMVLMFLGCLLPLILITVLTKYLVGTRFSIGNYSFLFILICPLIHILMMIFMFKQSKGGCHGHSDEDKK